MSLEPARLIDQALRELSKEVPIAALISLSKGRALDGLRQPHVVELGPMRAQAQLDIPKALPIRELGEGHDAKLLGAGEVFDVAVGAATGDDPVKTLPSG